MSHFVSIVSRVVGIIKDTGALFLVGLMLLTVTSIVFRLSGRVIQGSYEASEFIMVVTAGAAMCYTALRKRHVNVDLLLPRLPRRYRAIAESVNSLISAVVCGLLATTTIWLTFEKGFVGEGKTRLLGLPYFPIKCFFEFTLILLLLVFLINLYKPSSPRIEDNEPD